MKRKLTSPKEMNRLYEEWDTSRRAVLYERLLTAVMDNAFNRFVREEGKYAADEIAALVGAKIYRALPGYDGPSPLKPYDSSRGAFNAYQSTMARTTRLDYVSRRTASGVGEIELQYSGSDASLENLYHDAQGTGRRRYAPSEDDSVAREEPDCKISLNIMTFKINDIE